MHFAHGNTATHTETCMEWTNPASFCTKIVKDRSSSHKIKIKACKDGLQKTCLSCAVPLFWPGVLKVENNTHHYCTSAQTHNE